MNRRGVAAGLALVAVLAACRADENGGSTRADTRAHRTPVVVSVFEKLSFLEMAVHDGGGDLDLTGAAPTVQRWDHDVTIGVTGTTTPDDLLRVQENAAALSELIAPLTVTTTDRVSDADVLVHFVPRTEFAKMLGTHEYPADADGIAQPQVRDGGDDDGTIQSVTVVIDTGLAQHGRNHVISHELLHAVGLDHSTCRSSLMYAEGGDDASPLWSLSALDRRMVSLLYRPELAAGMSTAEVDQALDASAPAGVTCDPPQWQLVIDATDDRQYFCHAGAEQYRPCTSDLATEPTYPLADPDLWFDGTYVYDEFPLRP